MFKKTWMYWLVIVLVCGLVAGVFFGVFNSVYQTLPWWTYVTVAIICGLIAYLGYLLIQVRVQKFDRMLQKQNFHVDKRYEANGQTLCIDFEAKLIANTYLSTKPIVRFDEVVGCRVESFQRGSAQVLPDDERYLNVVLTVCRDDPTPEHAYLYIAMFEVKVAADDVPENPDVTAEMTAKYPDLQPLFDLKQDVEQILAQNGKLPSGTC